MALGPQKTGRADLIKHAERVIDDIIKGSREGCLTIDVSLLPNGFTISDWLPLRKKYLQAGWKSAKFVLDNRDGNYIELRA